MQIHLARDGASLGIFTADEIRQGLAEGRFRADDLAWQAGMEGWKPLREWPDFAAAPASFAASAVPAASESEVPWERSPSLGSLLRSVGMAFIRPAPLATARLGFGSVFGGAYLALALAAIPLIALAVFNATQERAQMEAVAAFAATISPEFAQGFREREAAAGVGNPLVIAGCGAACGATLAPIFGALLACLVWPGLRLLGARPGFGRTVAAFVLLSGWYLLAALPVNLVLSLLGLVHPLVGLAASFCVGLAMAVLFCRAVAAAIHCKLWQVIVAELLLLLLCCGCGLCLAGIVGAASAAAAG